jgi:hypothetical protein
VRRAQENDTPLDPVWPDAEGNYSVREAAGRRQGGGREAAGRRLHARAALLENGRYASILGGRNPDAAAS